MAFAEIHTPSNTKLLVIVAAVAAFVGGLIFEYAAMDRQIEAYKDH